MWSWMEADHRRERSLVLGIKTALGTAVSVWIALVSGLLNPWAAGTVTLLTVANSKRDTLRLSVQRLLSFFGVMFTCLAAESWLGWSFAVFGLVVLIVTFVTEWVGWQKTLSVNLLLVMHCFAQQGLDAGFFLNEFLIVLMGICIASLLNLFYFPKRDRQRLVDLRKQCDANLQAQLLHIAEYIRYPDHHVHPWRELEKLEQDLEYSLLLAEDVEGNSLEAGSHVHVKYFRMRQEQFALVERIHLDVRRLRSLSGGLQVADYVEWMAGFVLRHNNPQQQTERLEQLMEEMAGGQEPALSHVLWELHDFLMAKQSFLDGLDREETALFFSVVE